MYYLLATGRIVTESQMKLAFEISHGEKADEYPLAYKAWLDTIVGIEEAIPASKITVQELLNGNAFTAAVRLYEKTYNCTLREAKDAVMEIFTEMRNTNV